MTQKQKEKLHKFLEKPNENLWNEKKKW
jgi:hypothetical protein